MNKYSKIFIFFLLLLISNLYLLRPGFWFFQDAGYWPKTGQEATMMLSQQFHVFTNLGYALGFDQGLFNFTRIEVSVFQTVLFFALGHSGSQIVFALSGYALSFIAFYLFSGIFFVNKNIKYTLSLLYVFNPLSYTLQGAVFFNAVVPLFLYTYYKYIYEERGIRILYLLLNIFSSYLWVSYIRFFQSDFIVIVPYILYFFIIKKQNPQIKRIIIFALSYFLVFSPILFSVVAQILEKSQTAFNYGNIFSGFSVRYPLYNAFDLLQSVAPKIYEGKGWSVIGILFFSYVMYLISTFPKRQHSAIYFLNLGFVILSVTFYGLSNIFGNTGYKILIRVFPFLTNEPFWGFYVMAVPIIILVGIVMRERMKYLYIYTIIFVLFATFPLLNLSDFQLQKFDLAKVPNSYYEYFIKTNDGVAESTHFIPGVCWRAEYMDQEKIPTFCPNYGLRFVSVLLGDPRLASGDTFDFSKKLKDTTSVGNLRVIYNLKNIIVANDIVKTKGPGPLTGDKELQIVKDAKKSFDTNILLNVIKNNNFNHYYFENKNQYDFTLYSPKTVVYKNIEDITDNSLDINQVPVVLKKEHVINISPNLQAAKIFYKISSSNPTRYDVRISGIDQSKPFIIQLNQAYGQAWKIIFVDKNTFNKNPCIGEVKKFTITNNQMCRYDNGFFDLNSLNLMNGSEIKNDNHFAGNFLGNGWLIQNKDIPVALRGNNNLYVVIIYSKQIYYTYTILISGISLIALFIILIIQTFKKNSAAY